MADDAERLRRVLAFLSVSGGAALVSKRARAVVARSGRVDDALALEALAAVIEPEDAIVHVAPSALVAEVAPAHRLWVEVPAIPEPTFGARLRRARNLIERFALATGSSSGPAAPSGAAPAHATVVARRAPRS